MEWIDKIKDKLEPGQREILDQVINFSDEVKEMATMDGINSEIVILSTMGIFVSAINELYSSDDKDDNEAARGYVTGILYELSVILEEANDPLIQLGIKSNIDDARSVLYG